MHDFYDSYYAPADTAAAAEQSRLWRELSAAGKAEHIIALVARSGLPAPATVAEVGCGDGAVLAELGRRGFGSRRIALEISSTGAELARQRPEIDETVVYDGHTLPAADGAWDLVYATHVFEHLLDPAPLLVEMARVARVVVIEVPLEANLSGRRPAARAASAGVGHVQRFDRSQVRQLIADTGLQLRAELVDPLPREVHTFWAGGRAAELRATMKWAIRRSAGFMPPLAERLFTLHYAALATRD